MGRRGPWSRRGLASTWASGANATAVAWPHTRPQAVEFLTELSIWSLAAKETLPLIASSHTSSQNCPTEGVLHLDTLDTQGEQRSTPPRMVKDTLASSSTASSLHGTNGVPWAGQGSRTQSCPPHLHALFPELAPRTPHGEYSFTKATCVLPTVAANGPKSCIPRNEGPGYVFREAGQWPPA